VLPILSPKEHEQGSVSIAVYSNSKLNELMHKRHLFINHLNSIRSSPPMPDSANGPGALSTSVHIEDIRIETIYVVSNEHHYSAEKRIVTPYFRWKEVFRAPTQSLVLENIYSLE